MAGGVVDELHLVQAPVLPGGSERLFEGLGGAVAGCSCAEFAPSRSVTRVRLRRPRSEVFDTMES
jgi:riboflavin biosynthesis pyrimidine reductase